MHTYTNLPLSVLLLIGVATMALPIFQVCARQVGTIHVEPHRLRIRRWFRRLKPQRLAGVASLALVAIAAAVLWYLLAPAGGATDVNLHLAEAVPILSAPALVDRLKELRQEKADLLSEGERVIATAAHEKRALTDPEKKRSDEIEARVEGVNDLLARYDKHRGISRRSESDLGLGDATRALKALLPEDERVLAQFGGDPRCAYRTIAEFALDVRAACAPGAGMSQRLAQMTAAAGLRPMAVAPTNYHQETGGTAGEAFYVPPAFRQEIWDLVFTDEEAGNILSAVSPEPTSSNAVDMQADETTPWGATGIQAKWRGEGGQLTASKIDEKARQIRLGELYAFVLATEELLSDGPRLSSRLTRGAARAIRYKASDSIMHGDGVAKPLGWMKSPALVTVLKEGGQLADTIVKENIVKMFSRMLSSGIGGARWYINSDILPQLFLLVLGNNSVYVLPQNGFQQAPGGFLFGRPVVPVEHAETLGDKGDIQLVAPIGYYATVKQGEGVRFASSIHLYFDYGIEAFRWTFRLGGAPFLSAAVSPAKGTATKSFFITLEARV